MAQAVVLQKVEAIESGSQQYKNERKVCLQGQSTVGLGNQAQHPAKQALSAPPAAGLEPVGRPLMINTGQRQNWLFRINKLR